MAPLIEQFFPLILFGVPGGIVYMVGRAVSSKKKAERVDVTVFATTLSFLINVVVLGLLVWSGRLTGGFEGLNGALFDGDPATLVVWLSVTALVAVLYGIAVARYDIGSIPRILQYGRDVVRDSTPPWVSFGNRNEYVLVYTTGKKLFMGELSSWDASGSGRELVLRYPYEYVDGTPVPVYPDRSDATMSDERAELYLASDSVDRVVGIPPPTSAEPETKATTDSPTEPESAAPVSD